MHEISKPQVVFLLFYISFHIFSSQIVFPQELFQDFGETFLIFAFVYIAPERKSKVRNWVKELIYIVSMKSAFSAEKCNQLYTLITLSI